MIDINIAILAAGNGNRMGSTKQLEPFDGETLLARAVKTAIESKLGRVFVVLGYQREELARHIEGDVTILNNENWQEGIASSIRVAVMAVNENAANVVHQRKEGNVNATPFVHPENAGNVKNAGAGDAADTANNPQCRALLFMTIDQPFVDSRLLRAIATAFEETSKPVVASQYGTPGIPALFAREKFPDLLELKGDRGAKQLIMTSDSHLVEAPLAQFDIDTKSDLESCRQIDPDSFRRSKSPEEERAPVTLH